MPESFTSPKVVILQGLAKAPHLNGKTGTVAAAVDAATGGARRDDVFETQLNVDFPRRKLSSGSGELVLFSSKH